MTTDTEERTIPTDEAKVLLFKIRMVDSQEVSPGLVFEVYESEHDGYAEAVNGNQRFFVPMIEIDRLLGRTIPHWELVL